MEVVKYVYGDRYREGAWDQHADWHRANRFLVDDRCAALAFSGEVSTGADPWIERRTCKKMECTRGSDKPSQHIPYIQYLPRRAAPLANQEEFYLSKCQLPRSMTLSMEVKGWFEYPFHGMPIWMRDPLNKGRLPGPGRGGPGPQDPPGQPPPPLEPPPGRGPEIAATLEDMWERQVVVPAPTMGCSFLLSALRPGQPPPPPGTPPGRRPEAIVVAEPGWSLPAASSTDTAGPTGM